MGTSSSISDKAKVVVFLHYPFVTSDEYFGVTDIKLFGEHEKVLLIQMDGQAVHYMLENVLKFQVIQMPEKD